MFDRKSLKTVVGKTADFGELAKDCVAFANVRGGHLHIGIEDGQVFPPADQRVPQGLQDKVRRRINELTINVALAAEVCTADNGGEYIDLRIFPSASTIASTTDGSYYYRDDDQSRPLLPDELSRLLTDKPSFCWETKVSMNYHYSNADQTKTKTLCVSLRESDRVSDFVKEKSDVELLEYYNLIDEQGRLTNLGVLWIGNRMQRSKLLYSPVVQYIKYDDEGKKLSKMVWDDYELNPEELMSKIWESVPEWKESNEVSDGLWRKSIPCYDEKVVREVLCNALMHRPYTTRGDIFINMYPDRMEVVNPGLFPIGVTPKNILQKTIKRNEHLARLCFALHLMEGEGSGYDLMYETLLTAGKAVPIPTEGEDSVHVVIKRKILHNETAKLCEYIENSFEGIFQKNKIAIGLILAYGKMSLSELQRDLQLKTPDRLYEYVQALVDNGLLVTQGRGRGVKYSISPIVINNSKSNIKTTLKTIEPYRLRALIKEDLKYHPKSLWSDVAERLPDVNKEELQRMIRQMAKSGEINADEGRKFRRYW